MTDLFPGRNPSSSLRDSAPADALRGAVIAIGNFDGVHRGHRAVIAAAVARARTARRPAAALTFEPHPRRHSAPAASRMFRLTDETGKLRLLAATGLDGAIVLTFNRALASLSPEEFVRRILVERLAHRRRRRSASTSISARTARARPPSCRRRARAMASPSTCCRRCRTKAGRYRPAPSAPRSPPAA